MMQVDVTEWLSTWCDVLNTPDLQPVRRGGYVRTVTFALPFKFTATLIIWTVKHLTLRVTGEPDEIVFNTLDQFKEYCYTTLGAPRHQDMAALEHQTQLLHDQILSLRKEVARLSEENQSMREGVVNLYNSTPRRVMISSVGYTK
jgi:hypothetical protein